MSMSHGRASLPTRRSLVQIGALSVLGSAWELCNGFDQADAAKQPSISASKQPSIIASKQPIVSAPKQSDFSVVKQPESSAAWGYGMFERLIIRKIGPLFHATLLSMSGATHLLEKFMCLFKNRQ